MDTNGSPDEALLVRQKELEYESVMLGQQRYDRSREHGESGTSVCQKATEGTVGKLAQAIDAFTLSAGTAGAGRHHTAVKYLAHVLPDQAAYLTVRIAIDGAARGKKANPVAIDLGTALQDHLNLTGLSEEAPGLYRKVMEQVKKATTARHREGVLRHVVRKYRRETLSWSTGDKLSIGMKLLELFAESDNIVTLQRRTESRNDTPVHLEFTEVSRTKLEGMHEVWRDLHPVHQPMLLPPRDWHTERWTREDGTECAAIRGGYYTRAIRRSGLVQSRTPGAIRRLVANDLSGVYDAVNAVQRTAWRINRSVLDVMDEAWAAGIKYRDLLSEEDAPIPVRPAELTGVDKDVPVDSLSIEQREALTKWKRDASITYSENAKRAGNRASALMKLSTARKFKEEAKFYFPHYLDFRGRIYPYASYLNPQSDDMGRGLLEFAEGKPLGERGLWWLKVHIANLCGVDKVSFSERVKWTEAQHDHLLRSAASPLDYLWWARKDGGDSTDNPWQILAACFEYAGAQVEGAAYVSHIPVAMDGTCSGLQHYSAMLRDPIGGKAVNLVPDGKPDDLYTKVAKRAQDLSDSSDDANIARFRDAWAGRIVRKIVKQPTMTLCYSATVYGMQGQIERAVHKEGGDKYLDGVDPRQASQYLSHIVWEAIGDVVVAAKEGMAFLKECAALASEAKAAITWTAPSGFRVEQAYRKVQSRRVSVHFQGERIRLSVTDELEALDPKRQAAGVAPNFVHSLDSSHLMATVNLGADNELKHWACIHDSFGVHACDTDVLNACLREAFVEQYTPDVLARFREEIVEQLPPELAEKVPPVPRQSTLDLEAVRDSHYFFA